MRMSKASAVIAVLFFSVYILRGQHTPLNPFSIKVFTPFIINPAVAGSKDFMSVDFSAVIQGNDLSQLLSTNTRIAKKGPRYFGAPVAKSFTNLGFGAALFNDRNGSSRNLGGSVSLAYHFPLNEKKMSFLAGGITAKGIYNIMDSIPESGAPIRRSLIPNIDAGIYFYDQKFYGGISATNLLGNLADSTEMAIYSIPVSRQYFFHVGYKFVLSRQLNIVFEPSIIVNLDDSLLFGKKESYNPMLKMYMEAFCLGAIMHNYDNLTFFFQYRFPKFYIGTLVNFPRDVPFYKKDLSVEIAAGMNLGFMKDTSPGRYQW